MNDASTPTWRPTRHSGKIRSIGRDRPPPSIGSPTFVWHIGIWRDSVDQRGVNSAASHIPSSTAYIQSYAEQNRAFYQELFTFLDNLQRKGCLLDAEIEVPAIQPIILEGVANRNGVGEPYRFADFQKQSMTFTLWWRDDAGRGRINTRLSSQDTKLHDALRVVVQFQSYRDHATITFYVDGAKTFLGQQLHAQTDRALTSRQASFFKHLTTIRRTAYNEIHS